MGGVSRAFRVDSVRILRACLRRRNRRINKKEETVAAAAPSSSLPSSASSAPPKADGADGLRTGREGLSDWLMRKRPCLRFIGQTVFFVIGSYYSGRLHGRWWMWDTVEYLL